MPLFVSECYQYFWKWNQRSVIWSCTCSINPCVCMVNLCFIYNEIYFQVVLWCGAVWDSDSGWLPVPSPVKLRSAAGAKEWLQDGETRELQWWNVRLIYHNDPSFQTVMSGQILTAWWFRWFMVVWGNPHSMMIQALSGQILITWWFRPCLGKSS